jgi:hypothetical protein
MYVFSGVSDLTFASRVRGQEGSECQIRSTSLSRLGAAGSVSDTLPPDP